jgi:hypothetical protein
LARLTRDDFSKATRDKIAKLAGWRCSYPACRRETVGATSDREDTIDIGTAAHICAAAPLGPRYENNMTPEERSSARNGIWMCRDHGKAIDSNDPEFTVPRLRDWKRLAEQDSCRRVLRNEAPPPAPPTDAELMSKLQSAAKADVEVLRRTIKWPATAVALRLLVETFDEPVTTDALARAALSLDDLTLIAPPGMGKTTTLFQIAEGMVASGIGVPLVLSLGDWATDNLTVLASILRRPAFQPISEAEFRRAAAQPGIVLLLDGWNELSAEARIRARVQVETLKAELPGLALIVSTRKQSLDVPFRGMRVNLLPLDEEQQMQIAIAMRDDAGAQLLDQAWRTSGVRELVAIPLYLTALLSLPPGAPFPTTKEEILRSFVAAHERQAARAESLFGVLQGFQQQYLDGIAVAITSAAASGITDQGAMRSISDAGAALVQGGLIANKPEPRIVLDLLVDNHMLMRAADNVAVSFQHQQFQEWYASHSVERRIMGEIGAPKTRETLKAEVFNDHSWEEPILFAVERLSRGAPDQRTACAQAIAAAFEVDPMLAAEMIFRGTDEIWAGVAPIIVPTVTRWHKRDSVDRALRFMLTSARAEFFDTIWPFISNDNEQVSLHALRYCRQFRVSIFGKDAVAKIEALPQQPRTVLLHEIASHSGVDGLDLATAIARDDSNPEVQASVIEALAFRRADRHIAMVLEAASDATIDLIAHRELVDEVVSESVRVRLQSARDKRASGELPPQERLHRIVHARTSVDQSAEVVEIIGSMDIQKSQDSLMQLIYLARNRYPRAVENGLLARVRAGRPQFYGADDILAQAGFVLEETAVTDIALGDSGIRDDRVEAAASVLGPNAVGCLIDALFEVAKRTRDAGGHYNKAASDRHQALTARIAHVPGASLVAAVQERSAQANVEQIVLMAGLLSRPPRDNADRSRPFDTKSLEAIQALVEDWGNRLLASDSTERWQVARIASLASHAPGVRLLPLLKRLLDYNLRHFRFYRAQAVANGWRQGKAVNEARQPATTEYQRAFLAIKAPETTALMLEYLRDPHFGELAASVLAQHWIAANEPAQEWSRARGAEFRGTRERRAIRATDPEATSVEAEAIFAVVKSLIVDGASDEQKALAMALGRVASRLPHVKHRQTIESLLAIAHRRDRFAILTNLVFSGEQIDAEHVMTGLAETLEAAKTKETWILNQSDGYEWRSWFGLLPFTNRPAAALEAVKMVPEPHNHPRYFSELINRLGDTPSAGAEETLFALAEQDPRFYGEYDWRSAGCKIGTESAALRLIDLAASGALAQSSMDGWHVSRQLCALMDQYPSARRRAYDFVTGKAQPQTVELIIRAIAESPDAKGVLLIAEIDKNVTRRMLSSRTIEIVVTERLPAEGWSGAYHVVPVAATELRQKLFAMVTDGGITDAAALYLNAIDAVRDEYGAALTEPRHPDLDSGRPWPIIAEV